MTIFKTVVFPMAKLCHIAYLILMNCILLYFYIHWFFLPTAYQALTDEESRQNWEKYGNPDGPYAMTFGIALPSWIVEKQNTVWVLGLYALVIMVALPTAVGIWWYRSMRYTGEQVRRVFIHCFEKWNFPPLVFHLLLLWGAKLKARNSTFEVCSTVVVELS